MLADSGLLEIVLNFRNTISHFSSHFIKISVSSHQDHKLWWVLAVSDE